MQTSRTYFIYLPRASPAHTLPVFFLLFLSVAYYALVASTSFCPCVCVCLSVVQRLLNYFVSVMRWAYYGDREILIAISPSQLAEKRSNVVRGGGGGGGRVFYNMCALLF